MKKITYLFLKIILVGLLLNFSPQKGYAWDSSDFSILHNSDFSNTDAKISIICHNGWGNRINDELYLQVKKDGVWKNVLHIKYTVLTRFLGVPTSWEYSPTPMELWNNMELEWIPDPAGITEWKACEINMTRSPTGVYNSPVEFRIKEESTVKKEFDLTFYRFNPPKNLSASQNQCNQVELTWENPDNAVATTEDTTGFSEAFTFTYTVQRNNSYLATVINKQSYIDKTAIPGTDYNYRVKINEKIIIPVQPTPMIFEHESNYCSNVNGKPKDLLEAPGNVTASTNRCDGTVMIKWEWGGETPDNFKVRISTNSGFTANVLTLRNDILNTRDYYEDTTPVKNTTYYYRVSVKDDCGNWGVESASIEGYAPDIPETPVNINYSVSNEVIHVFWDHSGFEDKYVITRTNNKSGITTEFEVERDVNWFDDENAELCTPYTYEVKAINNCGTSSKVVSDKIVLTPDLSDTFWEGGFKASKGYFPDIVHLEWENNNRYDIDMFYIYRKKYGSSDSTLLSTVNATLSVFDDHYAENGVLYEYSIKGEKLCNGESVYSNVGNDIGFKMPTATVTGRVTFPAGIGVNKVSVLATTDDVIPFSSIMMGNSGYVSIPQSTEMDIESAFTFQAYVKFDGSSADQGIFEKNGNYKLTYESGKFKFYVGNEVVEFEKAMSGNEFIHISCVYDGNSAYIYISEKITDSDGITKDTLYSHSVIISTGVSNNSNDITFGLSNGIYLSGKIDEIRLWSRALESEEIFNDFNRYLSGKELGMLGYWRLNEGFSQGIYDISKTGSNFNENHGYFVNNSVNWSSDYPLKEQLGYLGITDLEGNYIIAGIPFTTGGSAYKFTPMLAPHQFNPEYKILFMNEDAPVVNNVDFIDMSVTKATLQVYYENTTYPVKGVIVKVDGNIISNANNELVQTDELGMVTFEVPLGYHNLSFEKANHVFTQPFFPAKDSLGIIIKHNFQKPVNINIEDSTRVLLVGKVAGGPVEAAKNLNSSINQGISNIGKGLIILKTVKGGITLENGSDTIQILTNSKTGEYKKWVLPEKYTPVTVETQSHTFDSEADNALVNLTNSFFDMYEADSIYDTSSGEKIFERLDTVSNYNSRRDWIYRSNPEFSVLNEDEEEIFGEQELTIKEQNGDSTIIPLIFTQNDSIKYVFGKPIFQSRYKYSLIIKAFEKYVNLDGSDPVIDLVPVTDGKVKIVNECANLLKNVEYSINEIGEVEYEFTGDVPNIISPFTKNLWITLITEQPNLNWGPLEAYVLGDLSTGANFTTEGPSVVDFILRDPPGSNSFAQIEKGSTVTSVSEWSVTNTTEIGAYINIDVGPEVTVDIGTPFASKENNIDITLEADITAEFAFTGGKGKTEVRSINFNEIFSTSDDPDFVGADGDVYVGHSTNIIYGISKIFGIFPKDNLPDGEKVDSTSNYMLAFGEALRLDLKPKTYFVYSQRVIEEEIIPGLIRIRDLGPVDSVEVYNKQINSWKQDVLAKNEKLKAESKPWDKHSNISFGAGSIYESRVSNETSSTEREIYNWTGTLGLEGAYGLKIDGVGVVLRAKVSNTTSGDYLVETQTDKTTSFGFTLSDQNPGNILTVDINKDKTNVNGPVFKTLGGQTSCPWEDAYITKYYDVGNQTLSVATMKIDGPKLTIQGDPMSPRIPETLPAVFTLNLSNTSEAEKDNWYIIGVDVHSNPDGAKVKMDGGSINSGVAVFVPYGETVVKTIEVYKGRADVNDYEDIGIYLSSTCDDISETVYISAYFASACSPVDFMKPKQGWLVNFENNDIMKIEVSGYNLQHTGFEYIYFQYTPHGTSNWITAHTFTNYPLQPNEMDKTYIDINSSVEFIWDMAELPDRGYDLRLVSSCTDGSINYSEVLSGILDGQLPQIFGTPQPADGILNVDDNILVQFNEPIEGGLLNNSNFYVKGTLNNYPIKHEAFIRYNGTTDHSYIPEGLSFNNKSFTIEFWVRPDVYANSVILSQGNDPELSVEIGLSGSDKTYFKLGNIEVVAPFQFSAMVPAEAWQHMAYVFDYETGDVLIYQNDKIILEEKGLSVTINNEGKIYLGKSSVSGGDYFKGDFHELRIWSKSWSLGDIYAKQYTALSGNEIGLYGYWPMDEAFGKLSVDKAANRHMEIFAPWIVDPGGSSWNFAGNNSLEFFTGYFAIIPEMDYTMEFWFKSNTPTDTICLFSSQKGDGNDGVDLMEETMSIFATPEGKIRVESMGNNFEATINNYFDDSWHHFAMVIRRRGNVVSYIDGIAQNERENIVLGGIAGGHMNLGVRKWDNVIGKGEDRYYEGKMDEFRLWNLAKTRTQISMDMNSKLHGDEIGLLVYFPFEGYTDDGFGNQVPFNTMKNYVPDVNASDAIPIVSGAYSADAPNVKGARPIEEIAFDFVAAEDQIIIMPKSYMMPQLEKNIIEITVERVFDKFGNRMASPVTWTAYVHRNQVRWEDERRSFTKEIYKPMDFVSSIKNTGGQQIGFTITNLPPWLSANPSSGNINPESTLEITFTINPALNIGEYNEDIILHTENGFDEKLPITVRVYKTPPDWKVDPAGFENSMNIVGRVKIEGVLSTDIFDKVAAFVNDSIRGVANVRYMKEFDSYLVFLTVYGNINKDQLVFRIWDASVGQILDEIIPDTIKFEVESILGSTRDPVIYEAIGLYRQYIAVAQGWNWVSFNKLARNQNNLNSFFSSLEPSQNDQIKTHGGGFSNFDLTNGWLVGSIDSVDNRRMYQMKTSKPDTVIYSGMEIIPEDNPISLSVGWNHIGYLPDLVMDVDDALRLYPALEGEVIKSQFTFAMFDDRVGWLGNLDIMQPNLGYKFLVQNNGSLIYPNSTVFKAAKIAIYSSPPLGWESDLSQYEGNMSVVARLDVRNVPEITINDQMVLGAFINGENHGFISPIVNSRIGYSPFFLNVSNSNNGQITEFRLFDGLTGNTFGIEEKRPFVQDVVYGSTQNPLVLTLKTLTTGLGDYNRETFLTCYPNPFGGYINIEFSGRPNKVSIDVVNSTGSLIQRIYDGYSVDGTNRVVWNGKNGKGVEVTSGIYYIRFISGDSVETVKISKTR